MAEPLRIFPFMPGGAADGATLPAGPFALADMTASPRFGLKGPGSADWLAAQGVPLPSVNRIGAYRDTRVLRLGKEDIVLLAEGAADALAELKSAWHRDTGPKGYLSWREEGWAWMRLSGPDLEERMRRLCALDLRRAYFGSDEIAQTRVGHVEAVLFRSGDAFDVLFDITASAFFARTVAAVTKHCSQDNQLEGNA
jgi:sarcosine oxidase subunit gamma